MTAPTRRAACAAALVFSLALALGGPGPAAAAADQRTVDLRLGERGGVMVGDETVDQLVDGEVLRVHVSGASAYGRGKVRQCVATVRDVARCTNAFPVQFREDGTASFQYQAIDPGGCDGTMPCVLVVDDLDAARRALAFTVFGGPAPPAPVATLTPPGPYEPGQAVRVDISGLTPGAEVSAGFCATQCGARHGAQAGPGGSAVVDVTIGERCRDCGLTVVAGVSSTTLDVPFVPAPAPRYDPARLVGGLVAAAALLVLAWRLAATIDWRPPSEAATPDLDAASLDGPSESWR